MDLVQLKYFCKVAELKSFTKAASVLHVAQPAITRQVQLLEDELGVQLLYRHSRGAEPTEEGLRLKDGAGSIFRLISQTRADVMSCSTTASGNLRIGFPPSMSDLLVGSTVATYRHLHPKVSLSLHEGYSHALRDALLADRIDLAILTGAEANPLLQTQHVCDENLWLIEPVSEARRPQGGVFDFAEVAKRSLVQPGVNNTMRQLLERKAAEHGLVLKIDVEAEALHVIKDLVQRGVGSHVSPYTAVRQDIENGKFSGGPIAGLSVARFLARRVDRPSNVALRSFQQLMLEQLTDLARSANGAIVLQSGMIGSST